LAKTGSKRAAFTGVYLANLLAERERPV